MLTINHNSIEGIKRRISRMKGNKFHQIFLTIRNRPWKWPQGPIRGGHIWTQQAERDKCEANVGSRQRNVWPNLHRLPLTILVIFGHESLVQRPICLSLWAYWIQIRRTSWGRTEGSRGRRPSGTQPNWKMQENGGTAANILKAEFEIT